MINDGSLLKYAGQVAIITGAARGLGREYALLLASRGASVVVNDLGGSRDGDGQSSAADNVVQEIQKIGGKAIADYNSVEQGDKIVKTAIDNFGRVDILINNAGILRDKSMMKMTDDDWDLVHRVHLRGSFLVSRAAWPYFREQNYGRIIMTSSPAGIYGNFGQANYSSAKLGLLALAKTMAVEGGKYNIKCNTIVPVAASRLTEDLLPEDIFKSLNPKYVAPIVAYLCHESCPVNGEAIEAAGGFYGRYRWQRSKGLMFPKPDEVTIENIRDSWNEITDMSSYSSPESVQDHTMKLVSQLQGEEEEEELEELASKAPSQPVNDVYEYNANDSILYALSVGVETSEEGSLKYLYENEDDFSALPTLGATMSVNSMYEGSLLQEVIEKYNLEDNLMRALHGEQFLKVYQPIPTGAKLRFDSKIVDVLDKGSGALIILGIDTYDDHGTKLFYNQLSIFMVGSGNFGGKRTSDNTEIIQCIDPPEREPDAVIFQKTTQEQAAMFRLCGDKNPLHIDPQLSGALGYEKPILHGLCTFGFAVRHALRQFCNYDSSHFDATKARFAGTVIPGQTIETRLWRSSHNNLTRIHYECFVKETGVKVISSAFVDLKPSSADSPDQSTRQQTSNSDNSPIDSTSVNYFTEREMTPQSSTDLCKIDQIFGGILTDKIHATPELVGIVKTIYQFNVLKNKKPQSTWTLDLKNGNGDIYQGVLKSGKPDCTISVEDDVITNIFLGKEDPIQAFMGGKLKITGNILAAQKLQQIWIENSSKEFASMQENKKVATYDDEQDRALIESIPISGLKCDLIFNIFRNRMHEEPDFVRRIAASYQFNVMLNGKFVTTWTAENKTVPQGAVYNEPYRRGKPDCLVTVEDDDLVQLMFGKLNPQRAFMLGKLKVKGNIMLLQKLNSLWLELQKLGRTPEMPYLMELITKTDLMPGIRSEMMVIELIQRLVRLPYLTKEIDNQVGFDVIKDSKNVVQYCLDLTKKNKFGIFDRGLPKGDKCCILTLDDDDFVRITYNRLTLEQAIEMKRVKVKGDQSVPAKISILFKTPTSRIKL